MPLFSLFGLIVNARNNQYTSMLLTLNQCSERGFRTELLSQIKTSKVTEVPQSAYFG